MDFWKCQSKGRWYKKLLKTYRWQNILDAWIKTSGNEDSDALLGKRKKGVLPFAPSIDGWTDDHYNMFSLVELALGNRKELSKSEAKEIEIAEKAEALIESGDPGWLEKIQELMREENFEDLDIDDVLFNDIDEEQRRRGE